MKVPVVLQVEEFYCVPACLKMVVLYLNDGILSVKIPDFELFEIAKIVKTRDGTWAPECKNMNPELVQAIPSVEFDGEWRVHKLPEIVEEIEAKRPCIALMKLTDGVRSTWHAVVITDIDVDGNSITFNDPNYPEERTMKLSSFQALWDAAWNTLVKVQIGRKTRTVLPQFMDVKKSES